MKHLKMSTYLDCRPCQFLLTRETLKAGRLHPPGGCRKIVFVESPWMKTLSPEGKHRARNEAQSAHDYRAGRLSACPITAAHSARPTDADRQRAEEDRAALFDAMLGDPLGDPFQEAF